MRYYLYNPELMAWLCSIYRDDEGSIHEELTANRDFAYIYYDYNEVKRIQNEFELQNHVIQEIS